GPVTEEPNREDGELKGGRSPDQDEGIVVEAVEVRGDDGRTERARFLDLDMAVPQGRLESIVILLGLGGTFVRTHGQEQRAVVQSGLDRGAWEVGFEVFLDQV